MDSSLNYLAYDEIGITFMVIVAAMGFVVLTWNAVKALQDMRAAAKKPTDERLDDHKERLDGHEERITSLEKFRDEARDKLAADWEFQKDEIEFNKLMLKSIKQLLKHGIDNNNTGGLEEMEKEIDGYLVEHKN